MYYPKFLKEKATIGVCAPSDGSSNQIDLVRLEFAKKNMNVHHIRVIDTPSCKTSTFGRSAIKEIRSKELEQLFLNSSIDAIICYAGGDFLVEMISCFPFSVVKEHPKWLQGYSDCTGLLFLITTNCDVATLYGENFKTFAMKTWHPALLNNLELLRGNLIVQHSFERYQKTRISYIVGDEEFRLDQEGQWHHPMGETSIQVSGRIIGGCLDILIELIGTRFDHTNEFIDKYKEDGIIWYFDNCELTSEDLVRAMWHLKEAGWFRYTKAILFGRSMTEESYYDISFEEAVKFSLKELNVPVITNMDIGHLPPQITIINGAIANIESKNGKGSIQFELG